MRQQPLSSLSIAPIATIRKVLVEKFKAVVINVWTLEKKTLWFNIRFSSFCERFQVTRTPNYLSFVYEMRPKEDPIDHTQKKARWYVRKTNRKIIHKSSFSDIIIDSSETDSGESSLSHKNDITFFSRVFCDLWRSLFSVLCWEVSRKIFWGVFSRASWKITRTSPNQFTERNSFMKG